MVSQLLGPYGSKVNEKWWWGFVGLLIVGVIGGNYYLAGYSVLLRILGSLILGGLAVGLALKTTLGQQVWSQWLEAVQEVRKIYWPTRQETVQTTLAVLAMVVVMGVLLWTADFALLRVVRWLMTSHWGA